MEKKAWEGILTVLCDYWWVLMGILILGLALFFTREFWLPLLGLG